MADKNIEEIMNTVKVTKAIFTDSYWNLMRECEKQEPQGYKRDRGREWYVATDYDILDTFEDKEGAKKYAFDYMTGTLALIEEYVQHKEREERKIFAKFDVTVDKEEHEQFLQQSKGKVQQILNEGLDVGTIIKQIVKVEITKHENEFYFKDKKGRLYRIDDNIK